MSTPEKTSINIGNSLFPVFLKLEKLRILVVGGGYIGLEKARALISNNPAASFTLVAKTFLPELKLLAASFPQIQLVEKAFEPEDLHHIQLLIVATSDRALNSHIRTLAAERGILVNVADTPDECDFYLGSVVQKGDLKIAISTNGKSPTIAKRLKETFNEALPDELNEVLQQIAAIRSQLKGDFTEKVKILNELTKTLAANSGHTA